LDLLGRGGRKAGAELEIAVLRLPSISNFSDLDPLESEPSVRLRWLKPGEPLGSPDAVILPGSKQTLADLAALRRAGLDAELRDYTAAGGHLFGLCGGLQLLGRELLDPEGLEGSAGGELEVSGLDLLPLRTVFGGAKTLRQRRSRALWPQAGEGIAAGVGGDLELGGFELHGGRTSVLAEGSQPLASDPDLGWWQPLGEGGGLVAGTYLHGGFESGPWRRQWLNRLRGRRGLPPLSLDQPHHSRQRDQLLDRLADAFEAHVNLEPLLTP
jgi:adenosylcobyric acid synthase